jgi:hypothetical protein
VHARVLLRGVSPWSERLHSQQRSVRSDPMSGVFCCARESLGSQLLQHIPGRRSWLLLGTGDCMDKHGGDWFLSVGKQPERDQRAEAVAARVVAWHSRRPMSRPGNGHVSLQNPNLPSQRWAMTARVSGLPPQVRCSPPVPPISVLYLGVPDESVFTTEVSLLLLCRILVGLWQQTGNGHPTGLGDADLLVWSTPTSPGPPTLQGVVRTPEQPSAQGPSSNGPQPEFAEWVVISPNAHDERRLPPPRSHWQAE